MEGRELCSPSGDEVAASSSSPSFAFLNHDSTTLPNSLPPSIDDRTTARQKRKRTSPEDQTILEAYYAQDPKPDKAARLDLVTKVALGEKEVQIWFQNRRQSSRRKSRPLLPYEIAQYQLAKSAVARGTEPDPSLPRGQLSSVNSQRDGMHASNYPSLQGTESLEQVRPGTSTSPQNNPTAAAACRQQACDPTRRKSQESSQDTRYVASFEASAVASFSTSFSADRQGVTSASDSQSANNILTHAHHSKSKSPRRVRKTSSFIRLSMNSEGGAELSAKNTSSPSPPRPPMVSYPVDASVSGASVNPLVPTTSQAPATTTGPTLHRAPSGRSRDSRAWEFWCDKDCRTELEEKAEKDASGSAADAIQLLRSNSGRNILGPISGKRNSTVEHLHSLKRLRREVRTPLQRSSTSNGRLQGKQLPIVEPTTKILPKLKGSKSALSVHITGNDSDKENWSPRSDLKPDEQADAAEGEAVGDGSSRKLGRRLTGSSSIQHDRSRPHRESIDPENDPEIAAFMKAGRESDKVSGHEELDCVQGLLSLSQGNWR